MARGRSQDNQQPLGGGTHMGYIYLVATHILQPLGVIVLQVMLPVHLPRREINGISIPFGQQCAPFVCTASC